MLKFYLVIIEFVGIVISSNDSWITHENYSYLIVKDEVNYSAASSKCLESRAQLVMVFNKSVQIFLEKSVEEQLSCNVSAYWIGLYDNSSVESTRFDNITPSYRNWNLPNEQHANDEYCVSMGYFRAIQPTCDFRWFSLLCNEILPGYICQKPEKSPHEQSYYLTTTTTTYETTRNNETNKTDDKTNGATFVATVISVVVLIVLSLFLFVGFNCWKDIKLEKKLRRKEAKANVIQSFRAEKPKESTKTSPDIEKGNYVLAKDVGNTFNEEPNNEEESSQNNSSDVEKNVDEAKLE